MNVHKWYQRSRVLFAIAVFLPFIFGDGALREVRAEIPPPYYDCQGEPIDPEDYQALLDYWAWLHDDVYVPLFGPSSPHPACEAGIFLQAEPTRTMVEGEPPDPNSPLPGPEIYYLTDQVVIAGHRVTEAGGLPVLLHVVHYVPLEELASPPEVPTVGVVVGVLHAGGGGGQEVPVMGLVTTLALAEPDPQAELGCCLPDGSFATLPAADCTAQGGSLALLGPLGDADGDGIDDSCAYEYGTLTFLTITNTLTAEELEAFEQYEQVVCELAGVCTWGYIQPPLGGDGGAGGDGLDGEGSDGDDDGSDGEAAQGGQGGSGGSGDGGGPSMQECLKKYMECRRDAADRFHTCTMEAQDSLRECVWIECGGIGGTAIALACGACLLTSGAAVLECIGCIAAVLGTLWCLRKCLRDYDGEVSNCKRFYNLELRLCDLQWAADGCGPMPWPI